VRKIVIIATTVLLLGSFAVLLSYHWPRTAEFQVMNTETKRIGSGERRRDQYRITAIRLKDDKRMVFRNEDAWYRFKFNSADLQGDAATAARNNTPVKITYYGWRSNIFSWFWNITRLKPLPKEASAEMLQRGATQE
jgi:hypothetical protein